MARSWMCEYHCAYGRNGYEYPIKCWETWQDEMPSPRAWSNCPDCGKRRAPKLSYEVTPEGAA